MTIDEAIKHCEEVAEEEEKQAIWLWSREGNPNYQNCVERVKKQRQLAEWLRELRKIKHLVSITEKLFKANFRGGLIDVVDGYDILFSEHKQLREIFEEVNADEDSD